MLTVTIRPAAPVDEPTIRKVVEAAYAPYVEAIGKRPAPMDAPFAILIGAGQIHVAIDENGAILGCIVFFMDGAHMLLDSVTTRPDMTGRGIGRALISFCEECARAKGAQAVKLYTNVKMTENLTRYPRLGYKETGRRQDRGFDRVYFEKRL